MDVIPPTGPSGDRPWEERSVGGGSGRPLRLLLAAGPASGVSGARPVFALPAAPRLLADAAGRPRFTLTLLLERQPRPEDETIQPFVRQGLLGFSLSAALTADDLARAEQALGRPLLPLFSRDVRFAFEGPGGEPLAGVAASGAAPRGALSILLSREHALAVLAALRGERSGLAIRAHLAYRGGSVEITAPLEEALADAFASVDGAERGRFVQLVAPTADGSGFAPAPRRVATPRSLPASRDAAATGARLAVRDDAFTALPLALTTERSLPSAHALLASDLVRPVATVAATHTFAADDLFIHRVDGARLPIKLALPLVTDPGAPFWHDRRDATAVWYAPELTLVTPQPNADPATSPFLFSFTQSGVTAGADGAPRPGLGGSIRLTLHAAMSAAARDALTAAGIAPEKARPVALNNLSVTLQIPFREPGTGTTRSQSFPATVTLDGATVTATVDLLDDWVRLAYGALAFAGFQTQPARLSVAFALRAYVPVAANRPQLAFGRKLAELDVSSRALPLAVAARPTLAAAPLSHSSVHIAALPVAANPPVAVVAHPPLAIAPIYLQQVEQASYGIQTLVRESAIDALLPCAQLGGFYRQTTADGSVAVGCRDALKLGEIAYQQYAEVSELRHELYRVWRSLQQPGRFILLPLGYRIGRYGPAEPADRAFRPAILIYAVVDADPAKTEYFFTANLEADVPYFLRQELLAKLAPFAPSGVTPILDLPTDPAAAAATSFHWALPAGFAAPQVTQTWNSFQVSLSTDLTAGAMLVTLLESGGILGGVDFSWGDGGRFSSTLILDTVVAGPWSSGPVAVALSGTTASLTNAIERSVDVPYLLCRKTGDAATRVDVEATLAAGEQRQVILPLAADEAWTAYAVTPGRSPLSELRVFVDDVTTTVAFINLVNFANHGLTGMAVAVRLVGETNAATLPLLEGQTASTVLTLPLTRYLEPQAIEFQVRATGGGAPTTTAWLPWSLNTQGSVVSVTWELIQGKGG